jgi:AcrR family transcriptional regulator
MNKENLNTGRAEQKRKTREDILAAAQQFLTSDTEFTLEDVAEHTNMSRATVYRYFSNVDLLCAEAALNIQTKTPEEIIEEVKNLNLRESLFHVQHYFNTLTHKHETAFQKYLSVVLDESIKNDKNKQLRGARRPIAVDAIMESHRQQMNATDFQNLKHIITVLSGIEPQVANKDVNGLSSKESNDLLRWALEMILTGVQSSKK